MKDRTLADIGERVHQLRKASPLSTVEIAARSGRSRDVLHRLERGEDVSLSSLLAILSVLGHAVEIVPGGPPSIEEMARRFARDDEAE